jgi:hypothetical protein
VPADHWAYTAVDTLQRAGIVIGYPDHTYGGKRAMTRYEFAVAIARLLNQINQPNPNYATQDQLNALRSDLEGRLAQNQQALNALQQLVNGFQDELRALGQDVAAIQRRLDALENRVNGLETRVGVVEDEQRRVKITGDLNIVARGDTAIHENSAGVPVSFYDENGSLVGNPTGANYSKRILQDSSVYSDLLLGIRGRVSDTATANVKIDFGNFLSSIGDTASLLGGSYVPGLSPNGGNYARNGATTGSQTVTLWEAYLDAPVKLGPLGGAELEVGRFPNQFSRYTLQEVDADVYTALYQTDSGNIPTDGGKLNFKAGPVTVQAFAGKMNSVPFVLVGGGYAGAGIPGTRPTGELASDQGAALIQGAGARASIGVAKYGTLSGTVEQFGLGTEVGDPGVTGRDNAYNRLSVYGADFNGSIPVLAKGGILIDASYDRSAEGFNSGFNNVGNSFRYDETDDQAGIALGPVYIKGGYQYVGPRYTAPGYWGRLGAWTNPTNVRGPVGSVKWTVTHNITLKGEIEQYKAAYGGEFSPLQSGDFLNHYLVGLGYGLSSAYGVDLGYEESDYDLRNAAGNLAHPGKPREQYITVGLGHSFNPNASFKLLYQWVSYDDKGTFFDPASEQGGANNGKTYGGIAVGQFSLKF